MTVATANEAVAQRVNERLKTHARNLICWWQVGSMSRRAVNPHLSVL